MAKSGPIMFPIPMIGYMPDKFHASYDGDKFEYYEEFNDIPPEAFANTVQMVQSLSQIYNLSADIDEENASFKLSGNIPVEFALGILISEMLGQATVHGMVPMETYPTVFCQMLTKLKEKRDELQMPDARDII